MFINSDNGKSLECYHSAVSISKPKAIRFLFRFCSKMSFLLHRECSIRHVIVGEMAISLMTCNFLVITWVS